MPWFLQSTEDRDTHRGVLSRGSVIALCGIRFEPLRITSRRVALSGRPHDPQQICPTCRLVEDTPMKHVARWAVSPTDQLTHLLARDGDHPDGAFAARCAELLPTTVVTADRPHGRVCCPCSVIANADLDLDYTW